MLLILGISFSVSTLHNYIRFQEGVFQEGAEIKRIVLLAPKQCSLIFCHIDTNY
jgi:hypothetical protein